MENSVCSRNTAIHSDEKNIIRSQCYECGKMFFNTSSLRRHARKFHEASANEIAAKLYKNPTKYNFTCQCGKNFTDKSNFNKHQKTHDLVESTSAGNNKTLKICSLCMESVSSKDEILNHLKETHEIVIESSTIKFNSEVEFYVWKNKFEADTKANFVKDNYNYSKKCRIHYFVCNRSGHYQPQPKSDRKRHLKIQGSYKINAYCPASIKLTINMDDNKCTVKYIHTHVGHETDPGYLNLSKPDRQIIAHQIAIKIPFDEILNNVRDNVDESDEISRIHLLRRKDLYNIEQCFNLSSSAVRHPNDSMSVESWVREMQVERNCVLFYKPQGIICGEQPHLKEDDFVLIIMTKAQKEFLAKYGSDVICLDSTHGLNSYDFELTTILVLDDLREGFPCVFLISNRSDKEVFKLMFTKMKEEINIMPKVFMSDMADSFYNAWVEVMGTTEKRLFCTWHVLRAWKKNLVKIKSKDRQSEVHKYLRNLITETDEHTFKTVLNNFLNLRHDPDTADFINYFQENYLNKIENWAYTYRLYAGINTNMHLESFHKSLKYIYLKGKNVKRLDKGICAIMRFVRDRLFDRLISRHKGKICSKVKEIRVRHKNISTLDENSLIDCEHGWEIQSSTTEEMYLIQKTDSDCKKCQLKCMTCNICIHEYICSCVDSAIKFNMCKHIHLVAKLSKKEIGRSDVPFGTGTTVNEDPERTADIEENTFILNEISRKGMKRSIEKEKEEIQNKLARHLKNINSPAKLQIVKNVLAPLSPTLAAIDSCSTSILTSPGNRIPHNKRITPQRSLFSTKKRNGKKLNRKNE